MSTEAMVMYMEGEVKLRKALKDVSLEDQEWDLKSYDCHDKAIVILYCHECKKDFGRINGQHTKERVRISFQFHIVGFAIVNCSHSRCRNAIVFRPLFGTCTIYIKKLCKKFACLKFINKYRMLKYVKVVFFYLQIRRENY